MKYIYEVYMKYIYERYPKYWQDCKQPLIIDNTVIRQVHKKKSVGTLKVDYGKALHSIPHSCLVEVLKIH